MGPPIKRADLTTLQRNAERVINTPQRINRETMTTEMDIPGFSYADFNRCAYINLWSLLKSMEALSRIAFKLNPESYSKDKNIGYVVAAQVIDIHPKLYEDVALNTPLLLSIKPATVGKRSYSYYADLEGKKNGLRYLRCHRTLGFVDIKNKRSALAPEDFKQIYKPLDDPEAKPVFIDQKKAPDNAVKYLMKVQHSDTDNQYHVNHSSYFRFCLDTAAAACNLDQLPNFHGDFCMYKISRAEILYKRECLPGDEIEVTLWEGNESPHNTLHFIISLEGKLVAVVNVNFFPEQPLISAKI